MSGPPRLSSLGEYLVSLVCLELSLADITSLRQTCRSLCTATRTKILWIYILERQNDQILPSYLKDYEQLDSATLEALVRRVSHLAHKWETENLTPILSWGLNLPQSITWLRLVTGRWLFVASSDSCTSKISCWDLSSVFQGSIEPLAEVYLRDQAKTGQVEVQESGIVLALGLGPESHAVHIITLRKYQGRRVFAELCRIEGSSHVLMLRSDLVACALRYGDAAPLYNKLDDIPCRRSVPHLMTIWNNTLVILRKNSSIAFAKLIETPTIWEAAVCASPSTSSIKNVPPLRLITISPIGTEMCVIEDDILAPDGGATCSNLCLDRRPQHYDPERLPWYRLCVGEAGRRSLRISIDLHEWKAPSFVYSSVPPSSYFGVAPSSIQTPRITWSDESPDPPALWAIPAIDFDEALGFTVVGNLFGELVIYDHSGQDPGRCADLAPDFTDQETPVPPLLPTTPLNPELPVAPDLVSDPYGRNYLVTWSQDNLDLDDQWSTTWFVPGITVYPSLDEWHGTPGDLAWMLEHAYGFPGRVLPQAFQDDPLTDGNNNIIFRLGTRYFSYRSDESEFRSLDGTPSGDFRRLNRWAEQAARGGRPAEYLTRLYLARM
ncbi:hypothetical protein B0H14DRAFT_2745071 [Mycena olivaceomarginata]|nr:hypothetical protein B0H14DRAFT_2745071 [Mycena olivaceomarginata]